MGDTACEPQPGRNDRLCGHRHKAGQMFYTSQKIHNFVLFCFFLNPLFLWGITKLQVYMGQILSRFLVPLPELMDAP